MDSRNSHTVGQSPSASLEPLETRRMMAFSAAVNFQPQNSSVPSGYVADAGEKYGSRGGFSYGWNKTITDMTRDRDTAGDQRYDTLIHTSRDGGDLKWEIAVPDGQYKVRIVSGDADFYDSNFKYKVEDTTVLDGKPSNSSRFVEATRTVTVSDGKLTLTNGSGADNNKIAFIEIEQISSNQTPQPPSPGNSGSFFDGVHVGTSTDPKKADPIMEDLGAGAVRIWCDISWNGRWQPYAFQRAKEWKAQGYHVTLLLHTSSVPTYSQAKAYFDWVQNLPGMKAAVDRWEIINEPNLDNYWQGSLKDYVDKALKPAWDSFHPNGEIVVGGGVSEDPRAMQTLVDNGYLKYCDIANVHPYKRNVDAQKSVVRQFKEIIGDKPLTATEWNVHGSSQTAWADMIDELHPFIEDNFESVYYYRLVVKESTYAGPAGLIKEDYSPHEPFYSTYKAFSEDGGLLNLDLPILGWL